MRLYASGDHYLFCIYILIKNVIKWELDMTRLIGGSQEILNLWVNYFNDNNVYGIKIHSEDFFNSFFIEKCLRTRRPVLIGVGGTYRSEIFDLVSPPDLVLYLNRLFLYFI